MATPAAHHATSTPFWVTTLLNLAHAIDHMFLLIFATAVSAIAAEWGMVWQDLMPYTVVDTSAEANASVVLLSIWHHRQLSIDFARLWPGATTPDQR